MRNVSNVQHLFDASWKYQRNSFMKAWASKSWEQVDLINDSAVISALDGLHLDTWFQMEADFDQSEPEVQVREQLDYYSFVVKAHILNVVPLHSKMNDTMELCQYIPNGRELKWHYQQALVIADSKKKKKNLDQNQDACKFMTKRFHMN